MDSAIEKLMKDKDAQVVGNVIIVRKDGQNVEAARRKDGVWSLSPAFRGDSSVAEKSAKRSEAAKKAAETRKAKAEAKAAAEAEAADESSDNE